MDPLQEYNSIILNRQRNPLPTDEYCERHHIIPRSCGGCNEEWNLVRLTPEEHYKCHELLPFIYTGGKEHRAMVFAWSLLSRQNGIEIGMETYGQLKRELSKARSEVMKGKNLSEETKRRLSNSLKGNKRHLGHHISDEAKRKISAVKRSKHKHLSEEQKAHLSQLQKGNYKTKLQQKLIAATAATTWMHNSVGKTKRVPSNEVQNHLDSGWLIGRKVAS